LGAISAQFINASLEQNIPLLLFVTSSCSILGAVMSILLPAHSPIEETKSNDARSNNGGVEMLAGRSNGNVGDNTNMFTILGDEEEDDGCGDSYRSDHEDSEEPENGAINVLHAVASAEST
jgi:hypothetical protein